MGKLTKVESNNRVKYYYNGELHHKFKPALTDTKGNRAWYQYGQLHRLGGPAVEYANGDKEWYIRGVKCTEQIYNAWFTLLYGPKS